MPGLNKIRFIRSLKQKKYRQKHQLFIVEGEKMVNELLKSSIEIDSVYGTAEWIVKYGLNPGPLAINKKEFRLDVIKASELERISNFTTPNMVLATARIPSFSITRDGLKDSLSLVLDKVQDPGNLGTLIRSADWFGVKTIILSHDSADITSPKVVQATMGSIFRINYIYTDLKDFLGSTLAGGIPVLGAFPDAPSVYSMDLPESGMIVLGNESKGISPEVTAFVSRKMSIPSLNRGDNPPESLNLAVAGSIIISEFSRRRLK
jgi:RNA methyltransferase, TrmH family